MKNLFDAHPEEPGGPKRERQAWIELARLNGINGLAGDVERIGQLRLCPIALGPKHLESILQR